MPQKAWSAKRERQYAHFKVELELMEPQEYGYKATFNPTIPVAQPKHEYGWVSPYHFGINEGPIVIMIENHRSGFLWSLMRKCPYLVTGLQRAGFTGGWL